MDRTIDLEATKLLQKYKFLNERFIQNNADKIQRYLVNTLGLKPINNKKPLNTAKPRQFVTRTECEGTLQYCIKISYGSKRVATVPTGCKEFEEEGIVNALTQTYHDLYADKFEGDFWNLFAENPEMAKRFILSSDPSVNELRVYREVDLKKKRKAA